MYNASYNKLIVLEKFITLALFEKKNYSVCSNVKLFDKVLLE